MYIYVYITRTHTHTNTHTFTYTHTPYLSLSLTHTHTPEAIATESRWKIKGEACSVSRTASNSPSYKILIYMYKSIFTYIRQKKSSTYEERHKLPLNLSRHYIYIIHM